MTTNETPPDWMTDEHLRSTEGSPKAPLVGPYAREILRLRAKVERITDENIEGGNEIRAVVEDRQRLSAELAAVEAITGRIADITTELGRPQGHDIAGWLRGVVAERDAARAEVGRLAKGAARQAMADDAMESELRRQLDAAIRDRHEFAARELERFCKDALPPTGPLCGATTLDHAISIRAAELRKAGGGTPWPPGVVADGGVIRVQMRPEPEANGAKLPDALANAHDQASAGDVRLGLLHLIDAVRSLAGPRWGGAS